jgi:hypothetical protein
MVHLGRSKLPDEGYLAHAPRGLISSRKHTGAADRRKGKKRGGVGTWRHP